MSVATVHLQGLGNFTGIPASDLQPGMRILWNFGNTSEVVEVSQKGQQSLRVIERINGTDYTRTMRRSRLVAAFWPSPQVA